ncbi:MAG: hypothetical protein PHN82_02515 [bacterium]|nr:hypothetical protein [bacterium]
MSDKFEIGADGVDVKAIMREIEERVARKKAAGVYERYDLSRVAALELSRVRSEADFLDYSLKVIQQTWDIDLSDFPIHSKGGVLGRPAALLKKVIWKLLKFYTYRLFSQQKEFNCQVANAVASLNRKLDRELAARKGGGDAGRPAD